MAQEDVFGSASVTAWDGCDDGGEGGGWDLENVVLGGARIVRDDSDDDNDDLNQSPQSRGRTDLPYWGMSFVFLSVACCRTKPAPLLPRYQDFRIGRLFRPRKVCGLFS